MNYAVSCMNIPNVMIIYITCLFNNWCFTTLIISGGIYNIREVADSCFIRAMAYFIVIQWSMTNMLHWIILKYAVSRMRMTHGLESSTALLSCVDILQFLLFFGSRTKIVANKISRNHFCLFVCLFFSNCAMMENDILYTVSNRCFRDYLKFWSVKTSES